MAETLFEKFSEQADEVEDLPKEKLKKFLSENTVKVFAPNDFDFPKNEKTQTQIRAEVDEFLTMREKWREEDKKLSPEREKSWR